MSFQLDTCRPNLDPAFIAGFHQEASESKDVMGLIFKQICGYYQQYNSASHIAPYAAMIGPNGMGKLSWSRRLPARVSMFPTPVSQVKGLQVTHIARRSRISLPSIQTVREQRFSSTFTLLRVSSTSKYVGTSESQPRDFSMLK